MRTLLAALVASLFVTALAQRAGVQSIIVNPAPGQLSVRTWVDRDPNKTGNPVYNPGNRIQIYVQTNVNAYVYLFSVRSTGEVSPIFPNAYDGGNYIAAGQVKVVPPFGAPYQFTVDYPPGQDRVLALASLQPLSFSQIADFSSGRSFVSGAQNLARSLSIVVQPVPNSNWATDEAYYQVGGGIVPPQPPRPPVPPQPPQPPAPPPQPSTIFETYNCNNAIAQATYSGLSNGNYSSVNLSIGGLQVRLTLQGIVGGTGLSQYVNGPYVWQRYASGTAQLITAGQVQYSCSRTLLR